LIFYECSRLKRPKRFNGSSKLFDRTFDRNAGFTADYAAFDRFHRSQRFLGQAFASVPKSF